MAVIPRKTSGIKSRIFSLREFYGMKKSRFTDSQIMDALKRVKAGFAVPGLCRDPGISMATFYKWRSKHGGMGVSLSARMKELEAENARLRKRYVEEKIKAEIVAEALAKKD